MSAHGNSGVFVDEIPSGDRLIVGVATSITVFLGRTIRGAVNTATTITSNADFVRTFGGLKYEYPMSYSVRDFFQNGGATAVIVRLYRPLSVEADTGPGAKATITAAGLMLEASSEGAWGNDLTISINLGGSQEIADQLGIPASQLFDLEVQDGNTGLRERFTSLSVLPGIRNAVTVLEQQSRLIRVASGAMPVVPTTSGIFGVDRMASDGHSLTDADYEGDDVLKTGMYALDNVDLFNLLCIPPDHRSQNTSADVYTKALDYCHKRRAMLIVDPPIEWHDLEAQMTSSTLKSHPRESLDSLNLAGAAARNAAIFFPRVHQADPDHGDQIDVFVPCGLIAGIFSRTDATRGVWKSPAGLDASIRGIQSLAVSMTEVEIDALNQVGINCLRALPGAGNVVWGSRTLLGDDRLADQFKFIAVRRTTLFIEESLSRGTRWAVFEPNDEPLWAQLRLSIGAFMHALFLQGAFQGSTPREAYFVKCDGETTTQNDINRGVVNVIVGFAPLKRAEFVVITLTQVAGQSEV